MANPTIPFGLRVAQHLNGSSFTDMVHEYFHLATDNVALYIGDPVITNHTANTDSQITPVVAQATNSGNIRGAVVGVRPTLTNLSLLYCPASTAQYILVNDSPFTVFEIMMNGTGTAAKVSGQNAALDLSTSGSTTSGLSGCQVSATTGTSDAQLRILRLAPIINNVLGANNVVEVMINDHELKSTTGT